jgi:hypothetical protein
VSRDSALAGGSHLTAAGRVSIHGGRASKTREFEVAYASATPSRGRGPTRGVWGAKYVRYEASARVARRRMSQERVLGLEIFLFELPKVTFNFRVEESSKHCSRNIICQMSTIWSRRASLPVGLSWILQIPNKSEQNHQRPTGRLALLLQSGSVRATTRQCAL